MAERDPHDYIPRSSGKGIVMPIGGAEDKEHNPDVLRAFIDLAGGASACVALIPTASDDPADAVNRYTRAFDELGVAEIMPIMAKTKKQVESEATLAVLRGASGIFISGGDQATLSKIYCGTAAAGCILERNDQGVVVGGTSAGAAFMASEMIVGGESRATPLKGMMDVAPGLGLLRNIVIDTHFGERGRTGRLMALHAEHPEIIAIGLDEDTAAIIDGDMVMRVVGSGSVTVVDGTSIRSDIREIKKGQPMMTSGVEIHTITSRFTFDLRARRFLPPLPSY